MVGYVLGEGREGGRGSVYLHWLLNIVAVGQDDDIDRLSAASWNSGLIVQAIGRDGFVHIDRACIRTCIAIILFGIIYTDALYATQRFTRRNLLSTLNCSLL